jgi:hypothetical protein
MTQMQPTIAKAMIAGRQRISHTQKTTRPTASIAGTVTRAGSVSWHLWVSGGVRFRCSPSGLALSQPPI